MPDSVVLSAVRDLLRASGVSPVASIAPFGAVLALTCWHAGRERIWVAARMEAGAIEGALLARTPRWRPMAELTREVFTLGRLDGLLDAAAALDWLGREAGAVADPLVLLDGEALPGAGTPHGADFERALLARATASAAILRLRAGAGAVPMTVPCPDRPAQREVAGTFLWENPRGAWLRRASPKRMQPKKRDLAHSRDEGRVGQVAAPVSVESWILQPGRFAGAEPRLHAHVRRLCDAHVQDNEETALPCPLQELVRGLKSALPDLAARKRPRRKASLLPSE